MTENEQIQEITRVLCADYGNCEGCPFAVCFADYSTCDKKEQAERIVLEKGYRKVERGEWILIANGLVCRWQCTVCGYETWDSADSDTDFCPCCGADMRGEKNEVLSDDDE